MVNRKLSEVSRFVHQTTAAHWQTQEEEEEEDTVSQMKHRETKM